MLLMPSPLVKKIKICQRLGKLLAQVECFFLLTVYNNAKYHGRLTAIVCHVRCIL